MALLTPLGPLDQLNTSEREIQKDLLLMDKHRLLEGLAIEGRMDNIFQQLPALGAKPLPLSLLRAAQPQKSNSWWIWNHLPDDPGADKLFDLLEKKNPRCVMGCDYDEEQQDFVLSRYFKRIGESVQKRLMYQRGVQKPSFSHPDPLLEEDARSLRAFFRLEDAKHNRDMFRDVVLHRLFKNCAIQPFYKYLWDVDTILELPNGRLVQLEIKHKFPGGVDELFFGLNNGQVRTMLELARCGIETFHINIVKPYWDSNAGTGYLLQDTNIFDNVLLVGHYLNEEALKALVRKKSGFSGATEALYGSKGSNSKAASNRQGPPFKPIPATEFVTLGTLADPEETLAANILAGASRNPLPPLTEQTLREKRLG